MAAINFPPNDTPSTVRTLYTISAPWTDPVNGGEWWFSSTKVRWMPVVAGGGASGFGDLGGVPADNTALADALALKAPLASPTFTGTVTASGAVNAGARVTATRGTVGVGTVYTDGSLAAIAGTSTDFLSRFVVGDLITFNTTVGGVTGPEERVITAIHSDTSMTTLPFSGPAASAAESYTHTTASATMNPSGAITGRTGTFSGAVSGTTGLFSGPVSVSGLTITGIPLSIDSGGTGASSAGAARTALGSKATGDALFQANTVGEASLILGIQSKTGTSTGLAAVGVSDITGLTGYTLEASTWYKLELHYLWTSTLSNFQINFVTTGTFERGGTTPALGQSMSGTTVISTTFFPTSDSTYFALRGSVGENRTNVGFFGYAYFKTGTSGTGKIQLQLLSGTTLSTINSAKAVLTKL